MENFSSVSSHAGPDNDDDDDDDDNNNNVVLSSAITKAAIRLTFGYHSSNFLIN
jgi:hypothetical protein